MQLRKKLFSLNEMTRIIKDSFLLNLKVMRIFGLYAPHKNPLLYKFQACMLYIVFIIPVPVLGSLYLFLGDDVDFVRVSENAFLLAEMGCYIIKFLPFIIKHGEMKKCIIYFESPFFIQFNNEFADILDDCRKTCIRNTKIFLVSVTCGVSSWAVKPLFLKYYRLPIDVWLPIDPTTSLVVYYSIYLYLVLDVAYAAYCSGVIDPLIAGLACQAAGQLKILKHNLQHLAEKNNIYEEIKRCINHHNEILTFVEDYEKSFSIVVFSQFVGSVLVICVSCLQLTMIEPLSFSFISLCMYLVTMLAEIYLFCYYGTILYEESNTIIEAIYLGEWYDYTISSQKALILIMERAKNPIMVTAAKILDLSLVTFTTILRRSYSLLAVLQNYNTADYL